MPVALQKLNSVSSNESYSDLDENNLSPEQKQEKEAYYRSIFERVNLNQIYIIYYLLIYKF